MSLLLFELQKSWGCIYLCCFLQLTAAAYQSVKSVWSPAFSHCRQRISDSQPTGYRLQKWERGQMLGSRGMDGEKLGPVGEIGPGVSEGE